MRDDGGNRWFHDSSIVYYPGKTNPPVPKGARRNEARKGYFCLQFSDGGSDQMVYRANRAYVKAVPRPLPLPDAKGNYTDDIHQEWVVVDRDPAGLNARLHGHTDRQEFIAPVGSWPVVARFRYGTRLHSLHGNRGNLMRTDPDGSKWYNVTDGHTKAWVRAHKDLIAPR